MTELRTIRFLDAGRAAFVAKRLRDYRYTVIYPGSELCGERSLECVDTDAPPTVAGNVGPGELHLDPHQVHRAFMLGRDVFAPDLHDKKSSSKLKFDNGDNG